MEHERDTPLNSEEDARRNEINALLATTPRLKSMFELFQSGKSVPRQSKEHPLQRPTFCLVPDLKAQPWWEPSEFPLVHLLQREYSAIRSEVLHVLGVSDVTLQPLESSTTDTTATDIAHPLTALPVRTPLHEIRASVARGEWRALYLWKEGQAVPAHHALCPHTTAVIGQFVEHGEHVTSAAPIDQSAVMQGTGLGYVYLSLLQPGTVIQSHCGPTNLRLRVHLGLSCDDSAQITVNGEARHWRAGECIVFDDSFEHAVYIGATPRLVLIVDVFHPHLTRNERQLIRALLPDVGGD